MSQPRGPRPTRNRAEWITQLRGHGRWAMPLVAFLLICSAPAGGAPAVRLDVETGFGEYLVPGAWTPLRVEMTAQATFDGVLEIEVPASRGPGRSSRYPVRFVTGARQQLYADAVIVDPRHPLVVRVLRGEQEVGRHVVPLGGARAVDAVVVVLTRTAAGLEFLSTFAGRIRPAYIREDALPMRWQSYEGVSTVVIHDLEEARMVATQRQALREWIAQGGRLLVTGHDLLLSLQSSWLLDLLPGVPRGITETQKSSLFPDLRAPLTIAVVSPRAGASVQPDRARPQTLQWRYGRGTVTLWTFDALAPSLRASPSVTAKWREVLTEARPAPVANRSMAEVLPSVPFLPGATQVGIALALVFYVVTLRWALRRVAPIRRGWLGVAALVVASAVSLYGAALRAHADATALFQASLAEAIPEVGLSRITTYAVLLPPYGGSFQLVAPAGATIRPLAGPAVNLFGPPVALADQAPPDGVKLELMQVVPFAVRGSTVLTASGLQVEIENASGLLIRAPVIYLNGQSYRLPDIQTHFNAVLDPTQWQPVDRQRGTSEDVAHRLRQWAFMRLGADAIIRRDQPLLVGWVEDARLAVRLRQARGGIAVHLLVIPLVAH